MTTEDNRSTKQSGDHSNTKINLASTFASMHWLLQSKSQSRLYQTRAVLESDATALIPAVQASAAGKLKAPRLQATALSPVASPARRAAVSGSPSRKALAAAETLQVQEKAGEVTPASRAVLVLTAPCHVLLSE